MKNVSSGKWLWGLLLLLTVLRLVMAGQQELTPDEAYYRLWSERLDASYYSKGPGVAYVMRLARTLVGDTEFGLRFFAPLLALGSSWLVWILGHRLFDRRVAILAVAVLNMTPIFNVGSILMTIDPLSIFFWLLAMVCFERVVWCGGEVGRGGAYNGSSRESTIGWWLATGLAIGVGFLCKYTSALQFISVGLILIFSRKWREFAKGQWLGVVGMVLVFIVCTLPVIFWNAKHGWVTVRHLVERGEIDSGFSVNFGEWFEFLGMHLGVYSPFLFIGIVLAILYFGWRVKSRGLPVGFLLAFALPVIVMYFVLAMNEAGQGNWTAPGFVSASLLLAAWWGEVGERAKYAKVLLVVGLAVAVVNALLPLHTDLLRAFNVDRKLSATFGNTDGWLYDKDPSKRLRGWKTAAEEIHRLTVACQNKYGKEVFVVTKRYQTAAALAFYSGENSVFFVPDKKFPIAHTMRYKKTENQFAFWPSYLNKTFEPSEEFLGKNALYVVDGENGNSVPKSLLKNFSKAELVGKFIVKRRGRNLRSWTIYCLFNFMSS